MDPKESHILSINICQKLYDIFMKILTTQTSKTVTLGCPPGQRSPMPVNLQPSSGPSTDYNVYPVNQEEVTMEKGSRTEMRNARGDPSSEGSVETLVDDKTGIFKSSSFHNRDENGLNRSSVGQEESILEDVSQMKGIKKSVSFHDRVEIIDRKKKKIKRSKSTEALTPMVLSDDAEQPLKPILQVPSDVNAAQNPNS